MDNSFPRDTQSEASPWGITAGSPAGLQLQCANTSAQPRVGRGQERKALFVPGVACAYDRSTEQGEEASVSRHSARPLPVLSPERPVALPCQAASRW